MQYTVTIGKGVCRCLAFISDWEVLLYYEGDNKNETGLQRILPLVFVNVNSNVQERNLMLFKCVQPRHTEQINFVPAKAGLSIEKRQSRIDSSTGRGLSCHKIRPRQGKSEQSNAALWVMPAF